MSYRRTLRETLRLNGDTLFDLQMLERLLDTIELRLRPVEDKKASLEAVEQLIRDVGLQRINEVLTPAIASVLLIQERGFLMARSSTSATIAADNVLTLVIDDEHERATFVPGPFPALTRESTPDDIAVTRLIGWEPETGELMIEVIAAFGDEGPHEDWVIVATAGVSNAVQSMLAEVRTRSDQVAADRMVVADDRATAVAARGEAVDARNIAVLAAEAAATFDPASYYPKAETYSKTEVDTGLGEKVGADGLVAAATSFDPAGLGMSAENVQAAFAELLSKLPFRNMEVFTSSGTWTRPEGVDKVLVIPINGGQGGGSGNGSLAGQGGKGGDAALALFDVSADVTVTIGAGGTGATGTNNSGRTNGGATSFGALTTSNVNSTYGGFRMEGAAGVTPGGLVNTGSGGSSGFGALYGLGGVGSPSSGGPGASGACIVLW